MKSRLAIILSLIINFAFAQTPEQLKIPKGVVYNFCSEEINNKARMLIINGLSQKNNYSLLQENLVIGPLLWNRYKHIEALQAIKNGNMEFHIDSLKVEGKMCKQIEDSKKVWDVLKDEIVGNTKIRKAQQEELRYYWSTISFDIEEPLYVIETPTRNYILNFTSNNVKLFWIDEIPTNKVYYNPIENKNYVAGGGFKNYQNGKEVSVKSKGEKETKLENVVLLNSDQEIEERSSVEDIKAVIIKTNAIFEELFKDSKKSGKIMIQFELGKKKNEIQFAVRDDLDLDIMKEFEKRVNKESYPNSKKKTVKLQLMYKVNSYNDVE
jgi:hypothetical protein